MQTAPQHKRKREEAEQRESTHKGKEKESSTSTNEEEEEQPSVIWQRPRKDSNTDVACPYLDTIRRNLLDFDFEKVCSVTSSNINVYCCLVCGKYFQGRGRNSQAYFHSLSSDHHVFINLHNEKVYCLPDDYEVDDHSLDDIKYVLHPRFSQQQIAHLDKNTSLSASLDGTVYLPGIVGLNNINNNDYINSIVQCLVHVPPLRNFFLREENYQNSKSHLVHTFGDLVRKMWNPRNFKGHVSPHELLQAVSSASNKHFKIGQQGDPLEFLSWLLNTLHKELGGTRKLGSSIIHQVFQGSVCVTTKPLAIKKEEMQISNNSSIEQLMKETTTKVSPFLFLSLDIPPAPLFKSEEEKTVIPQLPLFHCLQKFDGKTEYDDTTKGETRIYTITKLPQYLILHLKRFTKNNWFIEKNPTIVNFPVKNLEMKNYTSLKDYNMPTKYNLLTNLCHDGLPDKGCYKVYIQNKGNDKWYEIQDLIVKETLPQLVSLSEAYIQIYELKLENS